MSDKETREELLESFLARFENMDPMDLKPIVKHLFNLLADRCFRGSLTEIINKLNYIIEPWAGTKPTTIETYIENDFLGITLRYGYTVGKTVRLNIDLVGHSKKNELVSYYAMYVKTLELETPQGRAWITDEGDHDCAPC